MKTLLLLPLLVFATLLCWPLALVGMLVGAVLWVALLPLQLIGLTLGTLLAAPIALLCVPAFLLGRCSKA